MCRLKWNKCSGIVGWRQPFVPPPRPAVSGPAISHLSRLFRLKAENPPGPKGEALAAAARSGPLPPL